MSIALQFFLTDLLTNEINSQLLTFRVAPVSFTVICGVIKHATTCYSEGGPSWGVTWGAKLNLHEFLGVFWGVTGNG